MEGKNSDHQSMDPNKKIHEAMQAQQHKTSEQSKEVGAGISDTIEKVMTQLWSGLAKVINPLIWLSAADRLLAHPLYNCDGLVEHLATK